MEGNAERKKKWIAMWGNNEIVMHGNVKRVERYGWGIWKGEMWMGKWMEKKKIWMVFSGRENVWREEICGWDVKRGMYG